MELSGKKQGMRVVTSGGADNRLPASGSGRCQGPAVTPALLLWSFGDLSRVGPTRSISQVGYEHRAGSGLVGPELSVGVRVGWGPRVLSCREPVRGKTTVPPEGLCSRVPCIPPGGGVALTWGGRRAGAPAAGLDGQRGNPRALATIYLFLTVYFPSICIHAAMFGRSVSFETFLCLKSRCLFLAHFWPLSSWSSAVSINNC